MTPNPIPGNPEQLRVLVSYFHGGWSTIKQLRMRMAALHTASDWSSPAAEQFRQRALSTSARLGQVEARFWGGYWHLRPYISTLEEAKRIGRLGQDALDASLDALARANDHLREISGGEPTDVELGIAKGEVERLAQGAADARGKIRHAHDMLERAAAQCAANLAATINDPLRDDGGLLAGIRRGTRGLGDAIATNPLAAAISYQFGAVPTIVLGLSSSERGRDALEVASDALNVAGAVVGAVALFPPAAPIAEPIAAGLGLAGLTVDGALYARGRRSEKDLGVDAVALAAPGIGNAAAKVAGKLVVAGAKPLAAWDAAGLVAGTYKLAFRMYREGDAALPLAHRMFTRAVRGMVPPALKEAPGLVIDAYQGLGGAEGIWNRIRSLPPDVYAPRPVGLGGPLTAPAPTR